jgi:hypothetical protein
MIAAALSFFTSDRSGSRALHEAAVAPGWVADRQRGPEAPGGARLKRGTGAADNGGAGERRRPALCGHDANAPYGDASDDSGAVFWGDDNRGSICRPWPSHRIMSELLLPR